MVLLLLLFSSQKHLSDVLRAHVVVVVVVVRVAVVCLERLKLDERGRGRAPARGQRGHV